MRAGLAADASGSTVHTRCEVRDAQGRSDERLQPLHDAGAPERPLDQPEMDRAGQRPVLAGQGQEGAVVDPQDRRVLPAQQLGGEPLRRLQRNQTVEGTLPVLRAGGAGRSSPRTTRSSSTSRRGS